MRITTTLLLALLASFAQTPAFAAPSADWTVLVYMNGNNNLADFIPTNYDQMRKVGSSANLNIVIQYATAHKDQTDKYVSEGTWRVRVTTDKLKPRPQYADESLGSIDMGKPQTLTDFLKWGIAHYPASHYFLIIWNHGQGYRAEARIAGRPMPKRPGLPSAAPFRSVSFDDVYNSKLYVRQIEDALKGVESQDLHGHPIDIMGFDACLMAMVENAYAFRDAADILVASEELEPGDGWDYQPWLKALSTNSKMAPTQVATNVVAAYKAAYRTSDKTTTLSAMDLHGSLRLAKAVSQLGEGMMNLLPGAKASIGLARAACKTYAPKPYSGDDNDYFFYVDVGCIAAAAQEHLKNPAITAATTEIQNALKAAVLTKYTGDDRISFGTSGLTLYFPSTASQLANDVFAEHGYDKKNALAAVEFVSDPKIKWADFLHAYYPLGR